MKKLKLSTLQVSSFTTTEQAQFKGGERTSGVVVLPEPTSGPADGLGLTIVYCPIHTVIACESEAPTGCNFLVTNETQCEYQIINQPSEVGVPVG